MNVLVVQTLLYEEASSDVVVMINPTSESSMSCFHSSDICLKCSLRKYRLILDDVNHDSHHSRPSNRRIFLSGSSNILPKADNSSG